MAKTQKPNEDEKTVKENIEKRFKNMFTGENEPLSNMSLREVEALKARVAELEALAADQQTPSQDSKPITSATEPSIQLPSVRLVKKHPAEPQKEAAMSGRQKSVSSWVAAVFAVISLVLLSFSLYMVYIVGPGKPDLSDTTLEPVTVLMFFASLWSFFLFRRDRFGLGGWVLLSVALIPPIIAVLVLSDIYLAMVFYIAVLSFCVIASAFSKTARWQAILASCISILIVTGIQVWNPAFRLGSSTLPNFTTYSVAVVGLAIVIIFIIVRQLRNPRIQTRLIVFLMVIMVPLLVTISIIVTSIARVGMESGANTQLQASSNGLASGISTWLELNSNALEELTLQPDIINMNAEEQRPVLQAMAKAHPYMYLVSTTDLRGMNIARNDTGNLTDYSDRTWFQDIKSGAPIAYQSLIGKTTGQPALVIAMPIKNASGTMVGVGMFAASLTDLTKEVRVTTIGERGFTFLVDTNNQTLAHPDEKITAELRDMSKYPPVVALRQGQTGMITFTDENGERWRAYASTLDNGWAVIAQQPEREILAQANQFQGIATLLNLFGAIVMLLLVWITTRRTLRPIEVLTRTASAVAAGDLNSIAEVNTQDELGTLANTFNSMTSQIRNLVGNLEQRVADRTHDLELAAEVGRTITAKVAHLSEMLSEAVETIRGRFDLYYTQIYLTDPTAGKIILRAGTGQVGKELLQRGHNLIINPSSLNGRAVIQKQTQLVTDTKESTSFLPNPLLPKTRSEMCVPLIVDENVVGVLDMQSEQPGAFSESNLPAFEALAGQLAIAIRNAALFAEVQETRAEVEAQMGRFTEQGWEDLLNAIQEGHRIGFAFDNSQVVRLEPEVLSMPSNGDRLKMPVTVAGARVGEIQLPPNLKPNELELVKAVGEQLAQHLDNLRLLAQAETFRKEAEFAVRRLTHEGWETFLNAPRSDIGYEYDLNQVQPLSENKDLSAEQAFKQPLVIRDQTIGELNINLPKVSDEDMEILSAVAQQLSDHLETLRLSELNEKHAQREQTLRQLTSALRSSTNPTAIVRTAAREVGKILGRKTIVQVVSLEQASQAESVQGTVNKTDSPADPS